MVRKKRKSLYDTIPFDDPKEIQRDMYKYQCIHCRYEEEVPGYVVEEFVWWEEMDEEYAKTKEDRMPTLVCPKCEGMLKSK
ncbi:hypothetical protein [Serpentinicella alkaliphila]|uniref:Uncharacterized protein n=1 Tax=Serpentinicella alkaliphila TaxID=1734049 RepID=A0A4V2T1T7_9FIRM|nr:hypothetical protein [Serpentinicella alkaliphila]QUH25715.1 hypothetical protein HZR23_08165 [Serpentinicella alkaliphila]TCP94823.1 hypothetical protein EDD79_10711 [Serpentinicella alkaliphila]